MLLNNRHYRLRPHGDMLSTQMPSSHSSLTNSLQFSGALRHDTHIPISQSPSVVLSESFISAPQHAHCPVIKPTHLFFSFTTGSPPTFLSIIIWAASSIVASGVTVITFFVITSETLMESRNSLFFLHFYGIFKPRFPFWSIIILKIFLYLFLPSVVCLFYRIDGLIFF